MAVPSLTSNSPSAGNIAWGAFTIQYLGVGYTVSAGSTNQRWVWWRYNAGVSVIEAGADVPTNLTDDDLVLFGNKSGIGVRVQSATLIDGELLVDGSILAAAIGAGQIVAGKLAANAVEAGTIAAGAVTTNELDAGAVTAEKLDVGAVTAEKLSATAIDGMTVTGATIAGGTVIAGAPMAVAPPTGLIILSAAGGAWTLPTATYYYRMTGTNSGGETTGSNETSGVMTNGQSAPRLTWDTLPVGTTGVKIYRGTAAGAQNKLIGTVKGFEKIFDDLSIAGTVSSVPIVNTMANNSQVVKSDNNGLYAGGTSFATAPFRVDLAGNVDAPDGTITALAFRTKSSLQTNRRWEVSSDTANSSGGTTDRDNSLLAYTGAVGEVRPSSIVAGYMHTVSLPASDYHYLKLTPGTLNSWAAGVSGIEIRGPSRDGSVKGDIIHTATEHVFNGPITATGQITGESCVAKAPLGTSPNIATGTTTVVTTWGAASVATGGMVGQTNGIKVPVAGMYAVGGTLVWAGNATGRRIAGVSVNGVQDGSFTDSRAAVVASLAYTGPAAGFVSCAAGDVISLTGYQDSGSTLAIAAAGIMVWKIG